MKKSIAKKLANSGIGYHHVKQLFETQGEQGLLAILANSPTNSRTRRVRGTADSLTLLFIFSHFKGIQSWFSFTLYRVLLVERIFGSKKDSIRR